MTKASASQFKSIKQMILEKDIAEIDKIINREDGSGNDNVQQSKEQEELEFDNVMR